MKFKAPSRFINIQLPDGTERKVLIPAGLRKAVLPPDFVKVTFDEATEALNKSSEVGKTRIATERGFNGTLHYVKSNGVLYWGVRGDRLTDYAACGSFELHLPYWVESAAAALPAARGQGLYKAVLHALRAALRRKLLSDDILSEANMLVWSAIGVIDEGGDRFRINPGRGHFHRASISAAALSVARSIIAMEVA